MTASTADGFGQDFHAAFDQAPVAVAITNPGGVLLSVNPLLGALLGRRPDELIGRPLFEVCHADDLASAQAACSGLNRGTDRTRELECRLVHVDGRAVSVRVSTSKLLDETGAASHLVMRIEDITAHYALTDDLLRRALHDPLTGLPNRDLLSDRLTQALARHERTEEPLTLLCLDLDRFKYVNDTYGHATSDAVLAEVATRLTAALRAGDTVARFGGDEFVMICENTDRDQALHIAERITSDLAVPHHIDMVGAVVSVPVSIGSATTTHEPRKAADLIHAADVAMYQAKHRHRDRAAESDPESCHARTQEFLLSEPPESDCVSPIALQRTGVRTALVLLDPHEMRLPGCAYVWQATTCSRAPIHSVPASGWLTGDCESPYEMRLVLTAAAARLAGSKLVFDACAMPLRQFLTTGEVTTEEGGKLRCSPKYLGELSLTTAATRDP